jgi:uncharacterized protein (TIGR03435 family)
MNPPEVFPMNRNILQVLFCAAFFLGMTPTMRTAAAQSQTDNSSEKDPPMAAGADPSFEVATIRPSDPNDPKAANGWSFESEGHRIACKRATLVDILALVYSIQSRQIIGGPDWLSKERFDISGTPDVPGVPDVHQMQSMYKKLLADRFHLTLHQDKREMPIYAMTVAKGGPMLKTADPQENVNAGNSGSGGQGTMKFTNMSMKSFAMNLNFYEDRPVVDQTNLTGNYDFTLKWTYELSAEGEPGAPPSLFTAMREQLGLRLDAVKGPTDVIVIDHVEQPSEN